MAYSDRYLAMMSLGPKQIPHWEHWYCQEAERCLTGGIDYFEHPRQCRLRMAELYPELELPIPESDDPISRPEAGADDRGVHVDEQGGQHVRWGAGWTSQWEWGLGFRDAEEAFAFSPLAQGDLTGAPVVEAHDFRDEEKLYREYRQQFPAEWGDQAPEGSTASAYTYNTMFMWPLLTFGWEIFLEMCLDPRFARIMEEFAEINRRVFRAFARLPVNFVQCHDDIVNSRGPTCSPAWMHRYIFPRYEEFWSIVRAAGKRVIFITDGRADAYADDVMACGAAGIMTEPYTDFRAIARKHPNCFLCGEGDNRVLTRNDPAEIEAMVRRMVETGKMTGGYMMSIGNLLPHNIPGSAIRRYLDCSRRLARR